jgi:hypothetical protein
MSGKHKKPLLERAQAQIESRKGGYNGRENSFEFICRRWNVFLLNTFGDGAPQLSPFQVALMMHDFKIGRKEARRASGAGAHADDDEDAAAYLQWADMLDPDKQTDIPFEPRKVSDK